MSCGRRETWPLLAGETGATLPVLPVWLPASSCGHAGPADAVLFSQTLRRVGWVAPVENTAGFPHGLRPGVSLRRPLARLLEPPAFSPCSPSAGRSFSYRTGPPGCPEPQFPHRLSASQRAPPGSSGPGASSPPHRALRIRLPREPSLLQTQAFRVPCWAGQGRGWGVQRRPCWEGASVGGGGGDTGGGGAGR